MKVLIFFVNFLTFFSNFDFLHLIQLNVVRLLKEENQNLKKMLENLQKKLGGQGGVMLEDDKKAFLELKEQYEANQKMMGDMQKTFEEKLEEARKQENESIGTQVNISLPHLVVLNEDPQLSHKLKYPLDQLPVYVGRKTQFIINIFISHIMSFM